MASVSDSIDKLKGAYGGSDKTSGSFLRPEHVKYNSFLKAKDLGSVVNLSTTITGNVGSEVGANTLYFKVTTLGESDLLLTKQSLHKHKDKYIYHNTTKRANSHANFSIWINILAFF